MRLPITTTEGHQGKSLEFDCDQETVALLDGNGKLVASVSWAAVVKFITLSGDDKVFINSRNHPRAPLAVKVRYMTPEGKKFESLTGGLGSGGLFIESSSPLPRGSEVELEFSLPDRPSDRVTAKARVAWTRHKTERSLLFPGMGIEFTDIDASAQKRLEDLVIALNRCRQPG